MKTFDGSTIKPVLKNWFYLSFLHFKVSFKKDLNSPLYAQLPPECWC